MLDYGAALISVCAAAFAALLLVLSGPLHGRLTFDDVEGVQKLHKFPTPRIGGLAVLAGLFAGGQALGGEAWALWAPIALALAPVVVAGLAEDVTRRVRVRTRFWATCLSGLVFALASGARIGAIGVPWVDVLLELWLPSLVLTVFAVGGIANAINLIDGVNGLAAGSAVILFAAFAVICALCGDQALGALCLVGCGAALGFLLLNFPVAYLFLGDAGAYTLGVLLAGVAVLLPLRNPELSPLVGLLVLCYPVIETLVSIHRRLRRAGGHPARPDRLHLHSLVYRDLARRGARALGAPVLRNSVTGLMMLGFPAACAVLAVFSRDSSGRVALGVVLVGAAYGLLYRRVALLGFGARRLALTQRSLPRSEAVQRSAVWALPEPAGAMGMAEPAAAEFASVGFAASHRAGAPFTDPPFGGTPFAGSSFRGADRSGTERAVAGFSVLDPVGSDLAGAGLGGTGSAGSALRGPRFARSEFVRPESSEPRA